MQNDYRQTGASIVPVSRDQEHPQSFTQQRLWFLNELEGENAAYNEFLALELEGNLNQQALTRALQTILERHETLSTSFTSINGSPAQVVTPHLQVSLPVSDLAELSASELKEQTSLIVQKEANIPFDLAVAPLFRTRLIRLSDTSHILLLTLHHIVTDGWSMNVLKNELSILYQDYVNGAPPSLPPLAVQYIDFTHWQINYLQGDFLKQQVNYWKDQLADIPSVLNLPTDKPRPAFQTYAGTKHRLQITPELRQQLINFSKQSGVTLYMTLLAAFGVLLYRYSDQEDIVIGSPIANRSRREIEPLIGFFANTLALRIDLRGNPGFRELLTRVRGMCLDAYDNLDLPFEKLVEELQPERSLSHHPIFQTAFMFQNAPTSTVNLKNLRTTPFKVDTLTSKFDLTLSLSEATEGLEGFWEYSTDLFEDVTIERISGHFQILLEGILAAPDQALSALPILSEAERKELLVDWNATALAVEPDRLVHQLVEAQVDRTPAAVAVGFEDRTLSYEALDQQANQLAHHLQALGVGPEVLVGVALERSERMLVALLGVLKAGGACVPMDPDYPGARLAYMLEHATVPVVVSEQALLERLPVHAAQVACLDRDRDAIGARPTGRPAAAVQPEHLAYVIYTSGSTGQPKGVQVPHGAVVNFLSSMAQQPGMSARDVLLAVTTLSFDIAVLELYLPLTVGGRVQIASREVAGDGDQLLAALQAAGATVMQATPATWRLLLLAGWEGGEGFKVLAGGEALPRDLVNELVDRVGGVWNMYGPTETTVWSTCEFVTGKEGPVSIGRPIGNTPVYVLDKALQPVPVGVPGELYIGGRGVARGYLNAPQLTEVRFVDDPFASEPGGRLYRTGDQVRYRHDGRLEYLRRLDNQVKVRGFRIELGEIETVLSRHPAIKQGVVAVREERPGDVRLVAYIVTQPQQDITVTEVRKHLRTTLPEYMIPQHVVELAALPMTPSGKLDRQALPSPFAAGALEEDIYIAPRTETEQALAAVWQDVLGVERVGIHDNFFDMGGHSLLSIHLINCIKERLAIVLRPREILLNNLEQLAEYCDNMVPAGAQDSLPREAEGRPAGLFGRIKNRLGLSDA